jgi:hypothetical protein
MSLYGERTRAKEAELVQKKTSCDSGTLLSFLGCNKGCSASRSWRVTG